MKEETERNFRLRKTSVGKFLKKKYAIIIIFLKKTYNEHLIEILCSHVNLFTSYMCKQKQDKREKKLNKRKKKDRDLAYGSFSTLI